MSEKSRYWKWRGAPFPLKKQKNMKYWSPAYERSQWAFQHAITEYNILKSQGYKTRRMRFDQFRVGVGAVMIKYMGMDQMAPSGRKCSQCYANGKLWIRVICISIITSCDLIWAFLGSILIYDHQQKLTLSHYTSFKWWF